MIKRFIIVTALTALLLSACGAAVPTPPAGLTVTDALGRPVMDLTSSSSFFLRV